MIAILGCGALGSQIALHIAHPDYAYLLVDDDRVGEENVATSAYSHYHIGSMKTDALAALIYYKSRAVATSEPRTLTEANRLQTLINAELVVDTFDNSESRALACGLDVPTLHVGVSEERTGSVIWDTWYDLPQGPPRGEAEFCTHQVGRAVLRMTAAVAANVIQEYLENGQMLNIVVDELGVYK